MSVASSISSIIKRYFLSGVLVVVPLILTYLVLRLLFLAVDGVLQPFLHQVLGYYIPGLGLLTTLLVILLAGVLTRGYLGSRIYRMSDHVLERVPIIRPIYTAAKQLLSAVAGPTINSFKEVALIEYPRKGLWAVGFVSNRISVGIGAQTRDVATIFVPSTPTPVSGFVVLVPVEEVYPLTLSVEDGVKFLVSGGVASPEMIKERADGGTHSEPQNREVS
ncbi:MAG TPA: DUF502 domain-containing protein [candidate division Zixibacteria bacterium]|nr:DUF502 domain-containing protein [candidate division Zixibacteria bacterium]